MKRIEGSAFLKVPPVTLYADDLERIVELIGKGLNVAVVYGDYEYESLDEFRQRFSGQTLRSKLKLKPTHREPNARVDVEIEPDGATIWASNGSDPTGIATKHFLWKKSPWYAWTPTSSGGYLAMAALSMAMGVVLFGLVWAIGSQGWVPFLLAAVMGGSAWLLLIRWTPLFAGSRIVVVDRDLHAGFWTRNKDALLVNGIVALVGAILGFFVGRLTD